MIPVIFNHYSFAGFLAYPTPLLRHQQVIVIMNSEIIGLIRVGFMLCFERRSQYNSLTEWFTKSIQLKNIFVSLYSSVHYLQKWFAVFPDFFFSYLLLSILVYFNPHFLMISVIGIIDVSQLVTKKYIIYNIKYINGRKKSLFMRTYLICVDRSTVQLISKRN